MSTPDWRRLGFLTPDAYESQQDVWALQAHLRRLQAEVFTGLAERSAEPSWAASLQQGAERSLALADELVDEATPEGVARADEDDLVREALAALQEVVASDHVPSLMATGYAVLGELGALPLRLLADVAGPHAGLLCGRLLADDDHRMLGRLFTVLEPPPPVRQGVGRLLRHLEGQLFGVYQSWRQTFHALGVDGELLTEEGRTLVRSVRDTLHLKTSSADLATFR